MTPQPQLGGRSADWKSARQPGGRTRLRRVGRGVPSKPGALRRRFFAPAAALGLAGLLALGGAGAVTGAEAAADQPASPASPTAPPFRGVLFRLPWGSENPALQLHRETCADLHFWTAFLDRLAEDRFNALVLESGCATDWRSGARPATSPIPPNGPPDRRFWAALFQRARDRGIAPYWLIKAGAASGVSAPRPAPAAVTRLLDAHPPLAGVGIAWSDGDDPGRMRDWLAEVVLPGLKAARRPARLLCRLPGTGSPAAEKTAALVQALCARADLPEPVLLAFDFNGAHGHASPRRQTPAEGKPLPPNCRRVWTVRNEDFFVLRWGDPDFVRAFLAQNLGPDVAGCLIGSENYIPARDYVHQDGPHKTWRYAFERQWLFYQIWGRLLADPATPDTLFADALSRRYGDERGAALLAAYKHASRVPLILATFQRGLEEGGLYAEGFLANRRGKMEFLDLDTFIHHPPLDPRWLSIADYVKAGCHAAPGRTSPPEVARRLEEHADQVFKLVARQRAAGAVPPTLACELKDLESWAWLARYTAAKIRGGVAWETFRRDGAPAAKKTALLELQGALCAWRKVADAIGSHDRPTIPYFHDPHFSWQKHLIDAMADWRRVMGGAPGASPAPALFPRHPSSP